MRPLDLDAVQAFVLVADLHSFTRAAAKIGVSQSALSHTIRSLEERLGLRLLTRTTRSVAPTAAGERLLRTVGPRFEEIEDELDALTALCEKPAGDVRITAGEHPADDDRALQTYLELHGRALRQILLPQLRLFEDESRPSLGVVRLIAHHEVHGLPGLAEAMAAADSAGGAAVAGPNTGLIG